MGLESYFDVLIHPLPCRGGSRCTPIWSLSGWAPQPLLRKTPGGAPGPAHSLSLFPTLLPGGQMETLADLLHPHRTSLCREAPCSHFCHSPLSPLLVTPEELVLCLLTLRTRTHSHRPGLSLEQSRCSGLQWSILPAEVHTTCLEV